MENPSPGLDGQTGRVGVSAVGSDGIGVPRPHSGLAGNASMRYLPKTSPVLWQQTPEAVIDKGYRCRGLIACAYRYPKSFHLQVFACCPARRPSVVRGNTIAARQESGFKSGRVAVCVGLNSGLCLSPKQPGSSYGEPQPMLPEVSSRATREEIRGGSMSAKWRKLTAYVIQNPPYTVSKSFHPGIVLYSAWKRIPREKGGFDYPLALGCFKTLDEAKTACEANRESV